ncbi:hypothetical protein ANN_01235 [Periplaneta americana]|uniref:Uncharacterized protein n=1 Tax=Periplaneta americana TaxID=6978 RepID=A0ABQ8TT06_PERAM|nr:hypothetical protein ANN_01235 [Periplaneta americana]
MDLREVGYDGRDWIDLAQDRDRWRAYSNGRQHSLKCAKGKRSRPVCPFVQQEEVESIPASSYECTMVHCFLRGYYMRVDEARQIGKRAGLPEMLTPWTASGKSPQDSQEERSEPS